MKPASERAREVPQPEEKGGSPMPSFYKALGLTLSVYTASILFFLVPIIGWMLALTFVPYMASALGTRRASPSDRIPVSLTGSITWSLVETTVLIGIVNAIETPMGFVMGWMEVTLLITIWVLNILFGVLGAVRPWRDPFRDYKVR